MRLPTVAVDVVIFTIDEGELKALLVQVKKGPFAGKWAFPGGLVPHGESLETTARRELRELPEVAGVGDDGGVLTELFELVHGRDLNIPPRIRPPAGRFGRRLTTG